MQRILVALLAAIDAVVAAAVGLAVLVAPLTLLWVLVFDGSADWSLLWPLAANLWQFGHGAEVTVAIPDELVVALAIDPDAARFPLSLTPLAFLCFTAIFAARSGARAARAGAWLSGVLVGAATMAALSALVALTAQPGVFEVDAVAAILAPTLVYGIGAALGGVVGAWRHGGALLGPLRERLERLRGWGEVLPEAVRGAAIATLLLIGTAGVLFTLAVATGAAGIVGLYESLRVDGAGATIVTLGQLLYVPVFIVWAVSWLAGPGFAVGAGTAVSPVGTELGVLPAIPVFAALPEHTSIWTLIVVLVPVTAGALAGWAVRSRLVWLRGDLPVAARAAIAAGIGVLMAGFGAVAAALASGSIGPGRLGATGPDPGMLALALGVEVFIGAAILLLGPRNREELAAETARRGELPSSR